MDLSAFLSELRRRRVYRVAVVYAAVVFVIWQAADVPPGRPDRLGGLSLSMSQIRT